MAQSVTKRGSWSQEALSNAVDAVSKKKMSDYAAEKQFGVPRRTIRRYVKAGHDVKSKLGRKFTLTSEQEAELCTRIIRLSDIGFPLTTKILRLCVYTFCSQNNIKHQFSNIKCIASHLWARTFLKKNPTISVRKSQNLNPARAQKLNKFIVQDHFQKLKSLLEEHNILGKPERLYNMDEKGCRLNLHKEPRVLAKKGARRVHIVGPEHGESVTVVSCANAIGAAIPPMVLYKGKRMKPEYVDDLPHGSVCRMTERGSMTTKSFVDWLHHFGCHKPPGHCVLIFDGAKSHLDYEIVETAEQYEISLYCLPSNTTHELQPLDKAVFRSFEYHWDDEVMLYWSNNGERAITKQRFGKILNKVWDKSMTPSNIKSGFQATGIFPFNPNAIPEESFAPSIPTERPEPLATSTPQPTTSAVASRTTALILSPEANDPIEDAILDAEDDSEAVASFTDLLPTPKKRTGRIVKRKPAINSRAVVLKKPLFKEKQDGSSTKKPKETENTTEESRASVSRQKTMKESWFCHICEEDRVEDMRLCDTCGKYVHEQCVGLTQEDKGPFICPICEPRF